MKILFVCTGNTCRSPLAEAAWRGLPPELQMQAEVSSAGLMARAGAKASSNSVAVARNWNVDLSTHRARRIDDDMLTGTDLIVTMTGEGADLIRECFPNEAAKVQVLAKFAAFAADHEAHSGDIRRLAALLGFDADLLDSGDIDDPYGGNMQEYELVGAQIKRAVEGLAIAISRGEVASL